MKNNVFLSFLFFLWMLLFRIIDFRYSRYINETTLFFLYKTFTPLILSIFILPFKESIGAKLEIMQVPYCGKNLGRELVHQAINFKEVGFSHYSLNSSYLLFA